MKRKIYQIEEDETTLVYEEETDSNGNVIYFKYHELDPLMENYKQFNSKNLITTEREIEDGIEVAHLQ